MRKGGGADSKKRGEASYRAVEGKYDAMPSWRTVEKKETGSPEVAT